VRRRPEEDCVKVTIDQDRCIGSGQCVTAVPEVFDQREEDGVVILRTPGPAPRLAGDLKQAAAVCPAQAITVTD
jgi:ferredoxin